MRYPRLNTPYNPSFAALGWKSQKLKIVDEFCKHFWILNDFENIGNLLKNHEYICQVLSNFLRHLVPIISFILDINNRNRRFLIPTLMSTINLFRLLRKNSYYEMRETKVQEWLTATHLTIKGQRKSLFRIAAVAPAWRPPGTEKSL